MEPLHTASDDARESANRVAAETPLVPYRETVSREQFELPLSHMIGTNGARLAFVLETF